MSNILQCAAWLRCSVYYKPCCLIISGRFPLFPANHSHNTYPILHYNVYIHIQTTIAKGGQTLPRCYAVNLRNHPTLVLVLKYIMYI